MTPEPSTAKGSLTHERLLQVLAYDEGTGDFTWLVTRGKALQGHQAGQPLRSGYIGIGIDRRDYLAHRLAWFYVFGRWPAGQIDHINGDRHQNRIANLRDVTSAENNQNTLGPSCRNRSGILGIAPNRNKWRAQIVVGGKRTHLGTFSTQEEASAAYLEAKRQIHPMWAGQSVRSHA